MLRNYFSWFILDHFQELCEIWNTVNESFEQVGYTLDLKVVGEGTVEGSVSNVFLFLKNDACAFIVLICDHVGNSGH